MNPLLSEDRRDPTRLAAVNLACGRRMWKSGHFRSQCCQPAFFLSLAEEEKGLHAMGAEFDKTEGSRGQERPGSELFRKSTRSWFCTLACHLATHISFSGFQGNSQPARLAVHHPEHTVQGRANCIHARVVFRYGPSEAVPAKRVPFSGGATLLLRVPCPPAVRSSWDGAADGP